LASVGKEAFENVGWAITSNAIKVLSDKSLGIKNDTQIIDENELLPLAILGGGTSLLATGGSLVMKGLGKGIAKGTNRFTEKVKTDKIIKNTGDAVFYSTNVENIRTRLNPLYQNNVKNLDEVVFDNDWMDLVLKEIRTVYNSKTITKEDAIAEVLVNLDAMEYINIKNYKKIYLGLQDL
jgi:ASC-1-like (ASCH) protein